MPEESKERCCKCGHCVAICKSKAISIFNQPIEDLPEDDCLLSIMKKRRAIRNYKKDLIPEEEIFRIFVSNSSNRLPYCNAGILISIKLFNSCKQ